MLPILRNVFRGNLLERSRHIWANYRDIRRGTTPGSIFFENELKWLLGCNGSWLRRVAKEYRNSFYAWMLLSQFESRSRATDGYTLSLDVAEGFAVWALTKFLKPKVVVELGTQFGVSARLWKEALRKYVPGHSLFLIDTEDSRVFIGDLDATFYKEDGRTAFPRILKEEKVDLLFNDAHPYGLIRESVELSIADGVSALAFHDVGSKHPRASYRPEDASLSEKEKLELKDPGEGTYGHLERHVMAELFDERILSHDRVTTGTHKVQIFDSLFGFGVALKKP